MPRTPLRSLTACAAITCSLAASRANAQSPSPVFGALSLGAVLRFDPPTVRDEGTRAGALLQGGFGVPFARAFEFQLRAGLGIAHSSAYSSWGNLLGLARLDASFAYRLDAGPVMPWFALGFAGLVYAHQRGPQLDAMPLARVGLSIRTARDVWLDLFGDYAFELIDRQSMGDVFTLNVGLVLGGPPRR